MRSVHNNSAFLTCRLSYSVEGMDFAIVLVSVEDGLLLAAAVVVIIGTGLSLADVLGPGVTVKYWSTL